VATPVEIVYNKAIKHKLMAEEKPTFDYKSDSEEAIKPTAKASISWSASEYIHHQRGASWYAGLIGLTLGLAVLLFFLTKDVFGAIITLMLGGIVASVAHRQPENVTYQLTSRGLQVGQKEYSYGQFRSFAIVREGQLNSLVFIPLKKLMPPVSAFFQAEDERPIVALVGEHLPMEKRQPDKIDTLTRRLRF
jgi:hypothetical protein